MKIRNGFVTNSSSSSFIVAISNTATVDDVVAALDQHKDYITEILSDMNEKTDKKNVEKTIKNVAKFLFNEATDELNGVSFGGGIISNESDDVAEGILYCLGDFKTDKVMYKNKGY